MARVILGPDREPIDLGRSARLPSAAQRRGVLARGNGCVVAGCDAPHWLIDVHHLVHWTDGGNTDLDNLVGLCRWHHRRAHSKDFDLRRRPDGTYALVPTDHFSLAA